RRAFAMSCLAEILKRSKKDARPSPSKGKNSSSSPSVEAGSELGEAPRTPLLKGKRVRRRDRRQSPPRFSMLQQHGPQPLDTATRRDRLDRHHRFRSAPSLRDSEPHSAWHLRRGGHNAPSLFSRAKACPPPHRAHPLDLRRSLCPPLHCRPLRGEHRS